jgi:hypothetical protein
MFRSRRAHESYDESDLSRYQIGSLIARGNNSVFTGLDVQTHNVVAIKVLDLVLHPEKRASIQDEARKEWSVVKDLNHPHLIRYYGIEIQKVRVKVLSSITPRRMHVCLRWSTAPTDRCGKASRAIPWRSTCVGGMQRRLFLRILLLLMIRSCWDLSTCMNADSFIET